MGYVEYKWSGPKQATRPLEFGTCPNSNLCSQGHREHKMNVSMGRTFLKTTSQLKIFRQEVPNFHTKDNIPKYEYLFYNRNNSY